jgi:DNA modification methylase
MLELNKIYNMDCLEGLKQLDDNSVDLIVTDPPYYNFIKEEWDNQWDSLKEYLKWFKKWLFECIRILKQGSSIYIFGTHRVLSYLQCIMDNNSEIIYQNYLSWIYTMGISLEKNFSNQQEGILYYFKKGKEKVFNSDDIRVESQRQKDGDKRAGNEGKVPPNWFMFNRIQGNNNKRVNHPTQKPIYLIRTFIKVSSNEKDIILDPFMGSGTTAVACKQLNRNYIGFEIDKEYCKIAEKRLKQSNLNNWSKQTPNN